MMKMPQPSQLLILLVPPLLLVIGVSLYRTLNDGATVATSARRAMDQQRSCPRKCASAPLGSINDPEVKSSLNFISATSSQGIAVKVPMKETASASTYRPASIEQAPAGDATAGGELQRVILEDPTAPGNQIIVHGNMVAIDSRINTPSSQDLGISVSPVSPVPSVKSTSRPGISSQDTSSTSSSPQSSETVQLIPRRPRGTPDPVELFKAKWGWRAFEEAQRAGSTFPASRIR